MRNIKLTLEYDGSFFSGFQKQPDKRTVQAELEKAFLKLFRKKLKITSASGRTDAGVHAVSQIVNFKTDSKIPLQNIHRALNTYLPKDLAVKEIKEMDPKFHARFQAKAKTYEYVVWNSRTRSPLRESRSYQFPYALNLVLMKRAAKIFVGKHDFRSFQSQPNGRNSVRTIFKIKIEKHGNEICFRVEGDGFLYNMVRNLVGILLLAGRGKLSLKDCRRILKAKNRSHKGPTLPACGLTLMDVSY